MHRLTTVRNRLSTVAALLETRVALTENADTEANEEHGPIDCGIEEIDAMNLDELQSLYTSLLNQVKHLHETSVELDESARKIGIRLMDYCSTGPAEGRMSRIKEQEVARLADEHLANLPKDWEPSPLPWLGPPPLDGNEDDDDDEGYHHSDNTSADAYGGEEDDGQNGGFAIVEEYNELSKAELLEIEREWEGWTDDDYSWSPDDAKGIPVPDFFHEQTFDDGAADQESLEDTLSRMEEEWGEWENYVASQSGSSTRETETSLMSESSDGSEMDGVENTESDVVGPDYSQSEADLADSEQRKKKEWRFDRQMIGDAALIENDNTIQNQTNKSWE